MQQCIKILTCLSSFAVISNATANDSSATCSEDIANLKKQVTGLQNGLHNLNAFRVVGRDSVFNELKTKLETLTLNYEVLERRINNLTKNDKFTMTNPCDRYTRMPGVKKFEFTNSDYLAGTTHLHSIPIDSSANYNAYAVCYYDDFAYTSTSPSLIYVNSSVNYDVNPNSNYKNYSCQGSLSTQVINDSYLSVTKLDVQFASSYFKRQFHFKKYGYEKVDLEETDYLAFDCDEVGDQFLCNHNLYVRSVSDSKNVFFNEINFNFQNFHKRIGTKFDQSSKDYYTNINNYNNYIIHSGSSYIKSAKLIKKGNYDEANGLKKSADFVSSFFVYSYYSDIESDKARRHFPKFIAINNPKDDYGQYNTKRSFKTAEIGTTTIYQTDPYPFCKQDTIITSGLPNAVETTIHEKINYLDTSNGKNSIDLRVVVNRNSSKLHLYLVPVK